MCGRRGGRLALIQWAAWEHSRVRFWPYSRGEDVEPQGGGAAERGFIALPPPLPSSAPAPTPLSPFSRSRSHALTPSLHARCFALAQPAALVKPSLVTADQAWRLMEVKFAQKYKTVQKAFITLDMDGASPPPRLRRSGALPPGSLAGVGSLAAAAATTAAAAAASGAAPALTAPPRPARPAPSARARQATATSTCASSARRSSSWASTSRAPSSASSGASST